MEQKFFVCDICGNMISHVRSSGAPIVCCGEKMKEVVNKAHAKGKIVGTFVDDINTALKWKSLGIQYISYSVDVGIIYESFKEIVKDFN